MKKKNNILQKYWEGKLDINYDAELQYYKNLCGISDENKHSNKIHDENCNVLLYRDWKNHISTQIESVDINLLKEYSRFLNQKYRDSDIHFASMQTVLIPYIICLVGGFISYCFNVFSNNETFKMGINKVLFPLVLVILLVFVICTFKQIISLQRESIYKYFYQDVKEIVDERIEQIQSKRARG